MGTSAGNLAGRGIPLMPAVMSPMPCRENGARFRQLVRRSGEPCGSLPFTGPGYSPDREPECSAVCLVTWVAGIRAHRGTWVMSGDRVAEQRQHG